MVNKANAVFWDFDGVIMDSMHVRDKGFEIVLSSFDDLKVNQLLEYHRINGGLSRYVKFRYFYEEILKQSISEEEVNKLATKFSQVMMDLLVDENLLISDSLRFIEKHYEELPMHIVSGSDGIELNLICKLLNISKYFVSINGSPTPKNQLVKSLLKEYNYLPENVILIGDSINDFQAANEFGISFYGYRNPSLKTLSKEYINTFENFVL